MARQIQSLTQQCGHCTQRATESLRKFNLNRTWETGLQRRVAPTPRTQHTVLLSAQPPWNQANRNTLCPSELYITAKSEAWFPEKKKIISSSRYLMDLEAWCCTYKKKMKQTIQRGRARAGTGVGSHPARCWLDAERGFNFSSL